MHLIAVWNWKPEPHSVTLNGSHALVRELKKAFLGVVDTGISSENDVVVNLAGSAASESDKLAVVVVVKIYVGGSTGPLLGMRAQRERLQAALARACKKVYPDVPAEVMTQMLETGCRLD